MCTFDVKRRQILTGYNPYPALVKSLRSQPKETSENEDKAVADLRGEGASDGHGGPDSFNFMQFLGKFGKIVCWRPLDSWQPHLGEILDLQL